MKADYVQIHRVCARLWSIIATLLIAAACTALPTLTTAQILTVNESSSPITVTGGTTVTLRVQNVPGSSTDCVTLDFIDFSGFDGVHHQYFTWATGSTMTVSFAMPTVPGVYAGRYWQGCATQLAISPTVTVAPATAVSLTPPAPGPEQLKTDIGVYFEPALPAMGQAGSKIVDPHFGTTILRVTDGSTGADCRTPYTYYPTFNTTSTRIWAQCGNSAVFYNFDPATMTISNQVVAPNPHGVQWYDPVWSGVDPDVMYVNNNTDVFAYNVATQTYTPLRNFSSEIASKGASYIEQMSMSGNDDVFAASMGTGGNHNSYVVWKRSTNTILMNVQDMMADEAHVDRSGRYLVVQKTDGRPTVWDLSTNTMTQLGSYDGGTGFVHMDTGMGSVAAAHGSGLSYRKLDNPNTFTPILPGMFAFSNMHYSLHADNEKWAMVWTQRNDSLSNTRPFENEILQVATDGSQRVRRIAHHRSKWDDYYDQPNANISPDGQFVAFTSNWGNASGRRDVYIVKMPPAPTD